MDLVIDGLKFLDRHRQSDFAFIFARWPWGILTCTCPFSLMVFLKNKHTFKSNEGLTSETLC